MKTAQPFVTQGIDFIPVIPDSAVMQLATTFTEALEAHGTPFAEVCEFLELESESAEHEELLGKSEETRSRLGNADQSSISLGAIENGCPCFRTGIRKDSDCLVMADERVDPITADYAMPGLKGCSTFIENIAQQDSAATRTPLHGLLLPY